MTDKNKQDRQPKYETLQNFEFVAENVRTKVDRDGIDWLRFHTKHEDIPSQYVSFKPRKIVEVDLNDGLGGFKEEEQKKTKEELSEKLLEVAKRLQNGEHLKLKADVTRSDDGENVYYFIPLNSFEEVEAVKVEKEEGDDVIFGE